MRLKSLLHFGKNTRHDDVIISIDFLAQITKHWNTNFNSFWDSQIKFIRELEGMKETMKDHLENINFTLAHRRVYVPYVSGRDPLHIIVRIPPLEAKVFSSKTVIFLVCRK